MFSEETAAEIAAVARATGIEPAALLAVADVESGGRAFAIVADRLEPLIRFEGHYFDRRLSGRKRTRARAEGLAAPRAGAVANPETQAERWRLLADACAIDRKAALESCSWGLGQVMGAHWAWLGYADIDALVAEARSGAAGQARLMARYIARAGLADALRDRDWAAFARGYNGPGYRRNAYDRKMARAWYRYSVNTNEAGPKAHRVLRRGLRGADVARLQKRFVTLGHALAVDGDFGPETKRAVEEFQRDNGLVADGVAGPATREALWRTPAEAGFWARLRRWVFNIARLRP